MNTVFPIRARISRLLLAQRGKWLALCISMGTVLGLALAISFGHNFRSAQTTLPFVGVVRSVALPKGVVSLTQDVLSVQISLPDGDDFVRAYINNYLLVSNERPELLIHWSVDDEEQKKAALRFITREAVRRGHNRGLRGLNYYLRE